MFKYTIHEEAKLMVVSFTGAISYADQVEYVADLMEKATNDTGWSALLDVTKVDEISITNDDVHRLVALVRRTPEHGQGIRVALVIPQAVIVGMGRIYQILKEVAPYGIFNNHDAAMRFLGVSPS